MAYDCPMIIMAVIDRIHSYLAGLIDKVRTYWICWVSGVIHKGGIKFQGKTIVRSRRKGEICFGRNVRFNARFLSNLVGMSHATVVDTRQGGKVFIGDETGLSSPIISSRSSIKVGSHCMIGANVRIFDHDFHPLNWEDRRMPQRIENIRSIPVEIGDDCFIGTNAIILKGSVIGARSIVAAGSVVCGLVVPADSMVKGNPAVVTGHKRRD